jgi:hypothetical protein
MTPNEVFEINMGKIRSAVDRCVNEMAVLNDAAARVAGALEVVNELKVGLNTLRQTAAECPEVATEKSYKDALVSSKKMLSSSMENHELQLSVMGEIKAGAKASCEVVSNGLNALQSLCLNDQHRADVEALRAEITACQAALRD